MEAILLEYAWVLLVLVFLEGLLAADNAVVMAVMVKHLPREQQKKALFYGLFGAFIFRFVALFLITILAKYWEIQAVGAAYLLFISIKHLYDNHFKEKDEEDEQEEKKGSGFWMTVLKVELADIAFAIDSMLAAVAIAITLPHMGDFNIGGINGGPFVVMFLGGFIGLIIMRFAATNAALAWLGGGAIAAGGSGVAGGTLLLGMFGPIGVAVGAVSAVGGIMFMNSKNKEKRAEIEKNINTIKQDIQTIEPKLTKLTTLIARSDNNYQKRLRTMENWMKTVSPRDYSLWDDDKKHSLEKLVNAVSNTAQLINERI